MSGLRHWLAYWADARRPPILVTDEAVAEQRRGEGYRVEGPFVPTASAGAVDEERIARTLAECIVGVTVRREDEPAVVSRVHRDLAAYIVRGQ